MTARGEARRDRIVDYLRRSEGPAMGRTIAAGTKIPNGPSLYYHLHVLRNLGVLAFNSKHQRTIRLTETRVAGVVDGRAGWWTAV